MEGRWVPENIIELLNKYKACPASGFSVMWKKQNKQKDKTKQQKPFI